MDILEKNENHLKAPKPPNWHGKFECKFCFSLLKVYAEDVNYKRNYISFQCPVCIQENEFTVNYVKKNYPKNINVLFKYFLKLQGHCDYKLKQESVLF